MNKPPIKSYVELMLEELRNDPDKDKLRRLPRGRVIKPEDKKHNAKVLRFKPKMRVVK